MSDWAHLDMDAFYASVEQHDNPELAGKPVIVGGPKGSRGVVSACSYEARQFGVHSAMPTFQAERLCPTGVFLPVRMDRYRQVSRAIMERLSTMVPAVEQLSVDEAFLDLRGTRRLLGEADELARKLKEAVRDASGLKCTVGLAPSRYFAKLASAAAKPDGLLVLKPGEEAAFILSRELRHIWGLGKSGQQLLQANGIGSIAELRAVDVHRLRAIAGESAAGFLKLVAGGQDPGFFSREAGNHSISSEETFFRDVRDRETLVTAIMRHADEVYYRLHREGAATRTVVLKLRDTDFRLRTARTTLDHPLASLHELTDVAVGILDRKWEPGIPIRLLGVSVLAGEGNGQLELFEAGRAETRVDTAVNALRDRFGPGIIGPGRLLSTRREGQDPRDRGRARDP